MTVTYLFVLFIAVPYGPQVLTLSSDPKVTQEVAVESGVTGFCVEKAGETARKCTPSFQTPHAWVAMEHSVYVVLLRVHCVSTIARLYLLTYVCGHVHA